MFLHEARDDTARGAVTRVHHERRTSVLDFEEGLVHLAAERSSLESLSSAATPQQRQMMHYPCEGSGVASVPDPLDAVLQTGADCDARARCGPRMRTVPGSTPGVCGRRRAIMGLRGTWR